MAVRTKKEILETISGLSIEGDKVSSLMEDITDSFVDGGVSREEYDKLVVERDTAKATADDYRQRYINRFYKDYDEKDSKGYINSSSLQESIQKEEREERVTYASLFE